jgi:hypothetical protein
MTQRGERFLRRVESTEDLEVTVLATSRYPFPDRGEKCFACGRPLGRSPALVDTRDGQKVFVGRSCARRIEKAGDAGYEPPTGGPTLYLL